MNNLWRAQWAQTPKKVWSFILVTFGIIGAILGVFVFAHKDFIAIYVAVVRFFKN